MLVPTVKVLFATSASETTVSFAPPNLQKKAGLNE